MKELEPRILAMYLGTWATIEFDGRYLRISNNEEFTNGDWVVNGEIIHLFGVGHTKSLKLHLRRLEDMKPSEALEMYNQCYPQVGESVTDRIKIESMLNSVTTGVEFQGNISVKDFVREFQWLLSKSFDLFGLIDSGLAIDALTLTGENPNQAIK